MSFGVGDLVVCVDDSPTRDGFVTPLVRGRIYTVRETFKPGDISCIIDGVVVRSPGHAVRLVEAADMPARPNFRTRAYNASRFRPVRKTDISIFTSMLAPTPKEKVNENA